MPPTKCVAKDWFQYQDGIWSNKDKNMVRKVAWEAIHPNQRKAQRVTDVMELTEAALQVPKDTFKGAYKLSEGHVLINAANGVLVASEDGSVKLEPHSAEHHFTAKLDTEFDPEAKCPLFSQTLEQALPDQDDRRLLQRFAGYILFPSCQYEVALVCYGPSGTGKSTIVICFRNVLGDELCGSSGLEELCKSGSYSLPALKHKLLNLGSELCGTEIEESSNFKMLVSGEHLNVRPIYCAPEEMQSTCKLLFLSNNMPRFRAGTDAEARRLRILHFNNKPETVDSNLKDELKKESPGVLNWMIQGLVELLREQSIPGGGMASKDLMEIFNQNNDLVGSFVAAKCEFGPSSKVIKQSLYEAFEEWCEEIGTNAEKLENFFFKTLKSRYPKLKSSRSYVSGVREHCFQGIGLKDGDARTSAIKPEITPELLEKLRARPT